MHYKIGVTCVIGHVFLLCCNNTSNLFGVWSMCSYNTNNKANSIPYAVRKLERFGLNLYGDFSSLRITDIIPIIQGYRFHAWQCSWTYQWASDHTSGHKRITLVLRSWLVVLDAGQVEILITVIHSNKLPYPMMSRVAEELRMFVPRTCYPIHNKREFMNSKQVWGRV